MHTLASGRPITVRRKGGVAAPKLLFVVTEDSYFCSHRLRLACAARDAGYEVAVATRVNRHANLITAEHLTLIPIHLRRDSYRVDSEVAAIAELVQVYRRERPDIVHHVALKPILYGSIAAALTSVPHTVNAVAGLGFIFVSRSPRARLLRPLVRKAFRIVLNRTSSRLIVQNPDDHALMIDEIGVPEWRMKMIRGAGVDINQFLPSPEPEGVPVVMLASRMLWDKGIAEYVEAARFITARGLAARFVLVGDADLANPAAIPLATLEGWSEDKLVEWWGFRQDMASVLPQAHIICLPSYREGVPKVLVEAAACGRPIVTTNAPGCREVVRHGENGFLVPVRDQRALADALVVLLQDGALRRAFGHRGRQIAVSEFADDVVVEDTLNLYRDLVSP